MRTKGVLELLKLKDGPIFEDDKEMKISFLGQFKQF